MVSLAMLHLLALGLIVVGIGEFYGLTNGWAHILLGIVVCGLMGLVIGYLALRQAVFILL